MRNLIFAAVVCASVASCQTSSPADAAGNLCGDRDQLLKRLEQKHDERPQALGLSSDGGVLEVLVSPKGGWTLLMTYPKGPTCVIAVGTAWETVKTLVGNPI